MQDLCWNFVSLARACGLFETQYTRMTGFFWKRLCRLCLAVVPWPFEHVMWPGRYCICSCTLLLFNSPSMVATHPLVACGISNLVCWVCLCHQYGLFRPTVHCHRPPPPPPRPHADRACVCTGRLGRFYWSSIHGGCPTRDEEKWAANIWSLVLPVLAPLDRSHFYCLYCLISYHLVILASKRDEYNCILPPLWYIKNNEDNKIHQHHNAYPAYPLDISWSWQRLRGSRQPAHTAEKEL